MVVKECKGGRRVESEWHTIDEAATYCHLGRSTFLEWEIPRGLPSYGSRRNRRYHQTDLDNWMKNGFVFPGTETAAPGRTRKAQFRAAPGDLEGLIDPGTKRTFGKGTGHVSIPG